MESNKINADIAIIGAGITGTAIARRLCRYRLKTVVIEKEADVGWGTTKANTGLLHPGHVGEKGTARFEMCRPGSLLFRKNAQELGIPLKNSGSLLNILHKEQLKDLEALLAQGKKVGISQLKIIKNTGPSLKDLEPNIGKDVYAGLYCGEHYYTSPYEAAIALFENASANGVFFLFSQKAENIAYDSITKKFRITTSGGLGEGSNTLITSDYVINAAGLYADWVSSLIGDFSYRILPFKGQYYLLDSEAAGLVQRPNSLQPAVGETRTKGMVIAPTIDGNVLVGSNYEPSTKEGLHTSENELIEIKDSLAKMIKNIPFDKTITAFAGIRATSDTGDFVLGPSKVNEKFMHAGGIQSPGLTCAFIIAEVIEWHLKQKGLKTEKDPSYKPFRERPKRLDTKDFMANRPLFNEDSDWAEIVCRCEKVTKAQIKEAVAKGAYTLDGIKFRTRAGMGRCQGGYCTLKVLKIISQQTGIPENKITKSGGDSYIAGSRI